MKTKIKKVVKRTKNKIEKIGVIGVDSGMVWLGDPCYILHRSKENGSYSDIGTNWESFCAVLEGRQHLTKKPYAQFKYDAGHDGLGMCVQSGYGDGVYDVFAEYTHDGRVKKVFVEFVKE